MAAAKKYPVEIKERAVVMVRELERELGEGRGAIARVASQLGVHPEALRYARTPRDRLGGVIHEYAQIA